MEITKEYQTKLNLTVADIYSGELDSAIMTKLRDRFESKCESLSFVTEILGIKDRSLVYFDKGDTGGRGSVFVTFTAKAILYPKGFIMVGCKVLKMERGLNIICRYEHAIVTIKPNRRMLINQGDEIIVEVDGSRYIQGMSTVSVFGVPYLIPKSIEILTCDIKKSERPVSSLLESVRAAKKKLLDIDKPAADFFTQLLYPFKTLTIPGTKEIDIEDVIRAYNNKGELAKLGFKLGDVAILTRNNIIKKQEPHIWILTKNGVRMLQNKFGASVSVTMNMFDNAIIGFAQDFIMFADIIANAAKLYPVRDKYKNIWRFYNKYKEH